MRIPFVNIPEVGKESDPVLIHFSINLHTMKSVLSSEFRSKLNPVLIPSSICKGNQVNTKMRSENL